MDLAPSRRHRLLTLPAGLVLFVCLFVPATQDCTGPVYPYTLPFAWPPHLLGVAAMIGALRRLRTAAHVADARPFAIAMAVAAVVAAGWYALWLDERVVLVGLPLSFAASCWLAIGALLWRHDLAHVSPLPRATIARAALRPTARVPLVAILVALMLLTFAAILARVPATAPPDPYDETSFSPPDTHGFWGC